MADKYRVREGGGRNAHWWQGMNARAPQYLNINCGDVDSFQPVKSYPQRGWIPDRRGRLFNTKPSPPSVSLVATRHLDSGSRRHGDLNVAFTPKRDNTKQKGPAKVTLVPTTNKSTKTQTTSTRKKPPVSDRWRSRQVRGSPAPLSVSPHLPRATTPARVSSPLASLDNILRIKDINARAHEAGMKVTLTYTSQSRESDKETAGVDATNARIDDHHEDKDCVPFCLKNVEKIVVERTVSSGYLAKPSEKTSEKVSDIPHPDVEFNPDMTPLEPPRNRISKLKRFDERYNALDAFNCMLVQMKESPDRGKIELSRRRRKATVYKKRIRPIKWTPTESSLEEDASGGTEWEMTYSVDGYCKNSAIMYVDLKGKDSNDKTEVDTIGPNPNPGSTASLPAGSQSLPGENQTLSRSNQSLQDRIQSVPANIPSLPAENQSIPAENQSLSMEDQWQQDEIQLLPDKSRLFPNGHQSLQDGKPSLSGANESFSGSNNSILAGNQSLPDANHLIHNVNHSLKDVNQNEGNNTDQDTIQFFLQSHQRLADVDGYDQFPKQSSELPPTNQYIRDVHDYDPFFKRGTELPLTEVGEFDLSPKPSSEIPLTKQEIRDVDEYDQFSKYSSELPHTDVDDYDPFSKRSTELPLTKKYITDGDEHLYEYQLSLKDTILSPEESTYFVKDPFILGRNSMDLENMIL